VWGDPQVWSFDGVQSSGFHFNGQYYDDSKVDSYKDGDYYLVKKHGLEVQGRFWAAGGTYRSSMRELAFVFGNHSLVVKPQSIFLDTNIINAGANDVLLNYNGVVKVKPEASGLKISLPGDDTLSVWVQQGHDYVNSVITVKVCDDCGGVSGLCGNADGNGENDRPYMIGGNSSIDEGDDSFMAPPFDFLGCAAIEKIWVGAWHRANDAANAEMCSLQCKVLVPRIPPYPDFFIQKNALSHTNQVECYCGDIVQHAANVHISPHEDLSEFKAEMTACSGVVCMNNQPTLTKRGELCFFSDRPPVDVPPCTQAKQDLARVHCESTMALEVQACIIELCNAEPDEWTNITTLDNEFINNILALNVNPPPPNPFDPTLPPLVFPTTTAGPTNASTSNSSTTIASTTIASTTIASTTIATTTTFNADTAFLSENLTAFLNESNVAFLNESNVSTSTLAITHLPTTIATTTNALDVASSTLAITHLPTTTVSTSTFPLAHLTTNAANGCVDGIEDCDYFEENPASCIDEEDDLFSNSEQCCICGGGTNDCVDDSNSCEYFNENPTACIDEDDDLFSAAEQCCICQGGSEANPILLLQSSV